MKKDTVEFVGMVVKINGKRKLVKKGQVYFRGWGYENDDWSDNGIDVEWMNGKRKCKFDQDWLNY